MPVGPLTDVCPVPVVQIFWPNFCLEGGGVFAAQPVYRLMQQEDPDNTSDVHADGVRKVDSEFFLPRGLLEDNGEMYLCAEHQSPATQSSSSAALTLWATAMPWNLQVARIWALRRGTSWCSARASRKARNSSNFSSSMRSISRARFTAVRHQSRTRACPVFLSPRRMCPGEYWRSLYPVTPDVRASVGMQSASRDIASSYRSAEAREVIPAHT